MGSSVSEMSYASGMTAARLQLVAALLREDDVLRRSVCDAVALPVFAELGKVSLFNINLEMKRRIDDLVDDALLHLSKKESA